MPLNPEPDADVRWAIYRDDGDCFARVAGRWADNAKAALLAYLSDHPDQRERQRFAVRCKSFNGELFIFELLKPPPAIWELVQA